MSRVVDVSKPLSEDDVEYLKSHNDDRWQTAEIEKPKASPKAK